MKLQLSKPKLIVGCILSALFILLTCFSAKEFFIKTLGGTGIWLFIVCIIISLIAGAYLAVNIKILRPRIEKITNIVIMLLVPILSMAMVEYLNDVFINYFTPKNFISNYILYLLFYGIFYAITGSFRLSVMIFTPIVFCFALVHHFVFKFRGSPFLPTDFLSVGTAKDVASAYNYNITYQIVIAAVFLFLIMVIGYKLTTPRLHLSGKIISRIVPSVVSLLVCLVLLFTDIFSIHLGLAPDFWMQSRGYHTSGFLLNFCLNSKYTFLRKPSGYDANKIEKIVFASEKENTNNDTNYSTPNIICIMNESFSDLSVCGEFETTKDPLEYYNSLTENTIKGNLYVPVHGGGTSNTEYEFLTGNSTSFYPAGSNAYTLYVKNKTSSLVSTLDSLGYSKTAFHPYYSSGWNRKTVYANFGFDKFYNIVSVIDPNILLDYINNGNNPDDLIKMCEETYPGKNVLSRRYVSDEYNYETLIKYYENRDKNKPFFMFNVTMQNHGGYTGKYKNLDIDVKLTSTKGDYPLTETYLSSIKRSDEALKQLIEYFKNVDEPTVICFFGDHQPSVEKEFYEEIMGLSNLDSANIEQQQARFTTPFMIWANYDIEEQYIERLSANYLSSYLLKTANVKTTPYNDYLIELSKEIPVINTNGYIDKDGNYYKIGEKSEYSELIKEYNYVAHNNAIDKEHEKIICFY